MARKKDVDLYEKNPFITQISGLKTRAKRVTAKGGKAIIDTTTGEVEDVAEIVSVHRVDNEQFVKIFTSNLKQFFNLKPTTYRMVQVLLHQLGRARDRDTVYLNVSVAEQYFISTDQNPISKASYYNAMRELIQKGFIAESTNPNLYWINPALFFNGDRVRFVKEYRNTDWRQQQLDLADQAVQIRIFRLTTKAKRFDRFHEGRTYTLPCNVCDLAPRSG